MLSCGVSLLGEHRLGMESKAEFSRLFIWHERTPNKPLEWTGLRSTLFYLHKLPACHSGAAFEGCVVLDGNLQGSVA